MGDTEVTIDIENCLGAKELKRATNKGPPEPNRPSANGEDENANLRVSLPEV